MRIAFEHRLHPQIAKRERIRPATVEAEHVGINDRIALAITRAVGSMWCAYAFALVALIALPQALEGGLLAFVQWLSQTFIQLVMLSVIVVGQNVLGQASDKRALLTYEDAEATFHEAQQIQAHLKAQDEAINVLLEKLERLEAT